MKMKNADMILVTTIIATAAIAGLFYSYSVSVNPGLRQLPDREYLRAMQSINIAIQNPMFFLSFMGTLVMLPVCAYLQYRTGNTLAFSLLLVASILYLTAVFGVTIGGNVPLNEALAGIDLQSSAADTIAQQRELFEKPWLMFHQIRTYGAMATLLLAVLSCFARQ